MNLKQINQLNFEDVLLKKLNISPSRKIGNSLFYISPFRTAEKTPSFHVTLSKPYDLFYDHGNGLGGKIADFFIFYYKTNPKGVCELFTNNFSSFQQQNEIACERKKDNMTYRILDVKTIESSSLIEYLNSRYIPIELAKRYCKEIHYSLDGRFYFAIGFPTNKGFEIRNKYIKMCLNGKGLSWFKNGKNSLKILESWSDFLSFIALFPNDEFEYDYLILNSLSLLRKGLSDLITYDIIYCYFDNDIAGINSNKFLNNHFKNKVIDCSFIYKNYKDLNAFLVNEKNPNKIRYSLK